MPLTVNEDEPLVPLVKLRPFVEASVRVPFDAESVSESAFDPAAASVIEIALLFPLSNVNEPFSLREPLPGAEIAARSKRRPSAPRWSKPTAYHQDPRPKRITNRNRNKEKSADRPIRPRPH